MAKDLAKERAESLKQTKMLAELAAALGKSEAKLKLAQASAEKTKKELTGEDDE